jgi:hypothetical protein
MVTYYTTVRLNSQGLTPYPNFARQIPAFDGP